MTATDRPRPTLADGSAPTGPDLDVGRTSAHADSAVGARRDTVPAVVNDRYGSPDVLRTVRVPRPVPGDGQVLLEVTAASVNRADWHATTGLPYLVRAAEFGLRRPRTPVRGTDVAGTVVAVGADVDRLRTGDEVFGWADGAFTPLAVADADLLAPMPRRASAQVAAALPTTGTTALQAVRDLAEVDTGQRVLVVGASGGVGSVAVQLASGAGAEVTGVAGTANLDLVRSLGAAHVVDHRTQDVLDQDVRFDAIIDTAGAYGPASLRRLLRRDGVLVLVGGPPGRWVGGALRFGAAMALSTVVSQRLVPLYSSRRREDLLELSRRVDTDGLAAPLATTVDLDGVPDAIRAVGEGRAGGKVIVAP